MNQYVSIVWHFYFITAYNTCEIDDAEMLHTSLSHTIPAKARKSVASLSCPRVYLLAWKAHAMTNHWGLQYQSVAYKRYSCQLFDKDRTALVPFEYFLISYC